MTRIKTISLVSCAALCGALLIASFAHAESVVWSALQPNLISPGAGGPDRSTQFLNGAMVSISYNAHAKEVDEDGNVVRTLSCGSSVPEGTRVLFEFQPHEYTDIYWFGTGSVWDSPYGDWLAGAVAPPLAERCTEKNLYHVYTEYSSFSKTDVTHKLYAALSVAPSAKSTTVTGDAGSCTPQGDGQLCMLSNEGTETVTFSFAPTTGHFYSGNFYIDARGTNRVAAKNLAGFGGPGYCSKTSQTYTVPMQLNLGAATSGKKGGGTYTMEVPQQTIPCTIHVAEAAPDNNAPTSPNLSQGAGACVVGEPYVISMSASDPDGDDIRYAVDWDNNGSVDEYVPASGFVASGTTQTTSRTYASAGQKSVRVRAEDEKGLASAWKSFSFSCMPPADNSGGAGGGDGGGNSGGDNNNGNNNSGQGNGGFGNGGASGGNAVVLNLRAIPSLVRQGATTRVHWSSTNAVSCQVTGSNGDSWSGLQSPIGGQVSAAIPSRTTYTLNCRDVAGRSFTRQTTVNIIPVFNET
jgi:hypothetical protein